MEWSYDQTPLQGQDVATIRCQCSLPTELVTVGAGVDRCPTRDSLHMLVAPRNLWTVYGT